MTPRRIVRALTLDPETPVTRLLTTREVAAWLGLSTETVLRMWRAGDLPGFRISGSCLRFDPSEVRGWLEGRRLDP